MPFFAGKTKRMFCQRVKDHVADIKDGNLESPIARLFGDRHMYKFDTLQFKVLDRIHPNTRGGDFHNSILQFELRWIFIPKANHPPGLHGFASHAPFLKA